MSEPLVCCQDPNLRHTLQFGIGLHHAGLVEADRDLVESLFVGGRIQVLGCWVFFLFSFLLFCFLAKSLTHNDLCLVTPLPPAWCQQIAGIAIDPDTAL